MAGDFIIVNGDKIIFNPQFGPAIITPKPGKMKASGKESIDEKTKIMPCIVGDEKQVKVSGIKYIVGPFVIPGTGTLTIASLGPNQIAKKTKSGGKKVILKGASFKAEFIVQSPAKLPHPLSGVVPDPVPKYFGTGLFVPSNKKIKGE